MSIEDTLAAILQAQSDIRADLAALLNHHQGGDIPTNLTDACKKAGVQASLGRRLLELGHLAPYRIRNLKRTIELTPNDLRRAIQDYRGKKKTA